MGYGGTRKDAGQAIREAVRPLGTLEWAFIYGSVAAGEEDAFSDIDLMLIGALELMELAQVIAHLEDQLGREINYSVLTQSELAGRVAQGEPFVENVLAGPEASHIRGAFLRVLDALTPEAYQKALDKLPDAFEYEPLASGKDSLTAKQTLFQAWTTDDKLALVSTALDQCVKFLNRKLDNMQTLHGPQSGLATVNAWAITRNCWCFLKGAKRAGLSPLELAGADFSGIPWMQSVNLVLCAWPSLTLAAGALMAST